LTGDRAGLRQIGDQLHPATVIPPADRLDDDRPVHPPGELIDVLGSLDSCVARHSRTEGFQPSPHDELVLCVYQRLWRRSDVDALRNQLFQQLSGHMLVVEGERRTTGSDAMQRLEIGVRADHHVGTDLGGGIGGVGGQYTQALAHRDRRLVGHPGQLAPTDHGDLGRSVAGTRHGNHGVMAAERVI
jgi:hypothetical protein